MTSDRTPGGGSTKRVTIGQVRYATVIAFLAWTFAAYDFILFGTLLPEIGKDLGLTETDQSALATSVALGGVVTGLCVGYFVDRFGRKFGLIMTTGGAGLASALTALAGVVSLPLLIVIRAFAGLGIAEQGVNGVYLSELYSASDSKTLAKRRGFVFSWVQGGFPVGALIAAGLTALLLPRVGWQGCFIFAAVPALLVAAAATRLRETPQFEAIRDARTAAALDEQPAERHGPALKRNADWKEIFRKPTRRTTLVLACCHILNWFPAQVFSVLGTTVLVSVHNISFSSSLMILLLSNGVAYLGYLFFGYFGDRLGRRNMIAFGWIVGGVILGVMLYGPSNYSVVVTLYSLGLFFNIGPYACVVFFLGESFESKVRGTGAAFCTGIGPVGAILASAGATAILGAGGDWQQAALYFGVIPCVLSGLLVLLARNPVARSESDLLEDFASDGDPGPRPSWK